MTLEGFFFKNEQVTGKAKGSVAKGDPCEVCGLYRGCRSPRMPYTGEGRLGILLVAEAPGSEEDRQNTQLVGNVGQYFRGWLKELDLDLDRDFWKMNAISCRPPDNRTPTRKEIKCCRSRVEMAIGELKPSAIWIVGGAAVESFFMDRWSDNLSISRWRGRCIPDSRYNTRLLPLFHPSFVVRNKGENTLAFYRRDLKWAKGCSVDKAPPEFFDPEEYVRVLSDVGEVVSWIEGTYDRTDPVVVDFETTCISPYKQNGKILVVGLCQAGDAVAFPLDWPNMWSGSDLKIIKGFLSELFGRSPKMIAHNIKFEEGWTRQQFGVGVKNWYWDTMLAEHVLDCRSEVVGLKYQAYVRWGVVGYGDYVKPFLGREDEQGYNSLAEADWKKVCLYCGCDVFLEHELWVDQTKRLRGKMKGAYQLLHEGVLAFADAEQDGISVDEKYYEREKFRLTKEIDKIKKDLLEGGEAELFQKAMDRPIKLGSSADLRYLLYTVLEANPLKVTGKGSPSVDQDVLEHLGVPFTNDLVRLRKLLKTRDTYLAQFQREVVNGKIHPSFNLHTARTYRSSASGPSFQNIPVRDEDAKKSVRTGIVPSPGYKLLEVDFSSLEFRIAACVSRDPELEKYVLDPSTDIHSDQALELFFLRKSQVSDKIRFHTKNGYVFPELYGSYWKSIAGDLWPLTMELDLRGLSLREHLKGKGILTLADFEEHVKGVEVNFWQRFRGHREWQNYMLDFYTRKGYVEMFFGFRRGDYLEKNKIINSPIQGTAFHCLLWSFIELNKLRKEEEWKTKLIGQIHDDIIFDLWPEEQEHVLEMSRWMMTEKIREEHAWLTVPLEIKAKISEVDGNWDAQKKVGGGEDD